MEARLLFWSLPILISQLRTSAGLVILAQNDQSGFISIDCGLSERANYTDPDTGIFYTSDAGFTDSGLNVAIASPPADYAKPPFSSVRSFPQGIRNCYTLRPAGGKNSNFLIRAVFMYGNYDGKRQPPEFDLYLGEDFWDTLSFGNADNATRLEIIHKPSTDFINICLQKTGQTTPFISAIELRPLNNNYYITQSGSLLLYERLDLGSKFGELVRYNDDVYDRIWRSDGPDYLFPDTTSLSTNLTVGTNSFQLPSAVMSTAATPRNPSDPLHMSWEPRNASDQFYLYLHFAEVEKLQSNESRQFRVFINGEIWYQELSPQYLQAVFLLSDYLLQGQTKYKLSINATATSTVPPIINALELYAVKKFNNRGTDDSDVAAIFGIKSYYGVKRNWQGDPCLPQAFTWEGLNCYNDDNNYRIISLNLSSSGLSGSISPHIANFTSLQTLDLSNNNLNGSVPSFLAQLAFLKTLNLAGNNFSGLIPRELLEKSKQGLSFSIEGLPNNANSDTGKKKNKVVTPIVASTLATFLVVLFVFTTMCTIRRRRRKTVMNLNKNDGALQNKNWAFTYSEISKMTNNFERVLGKGGFGTVYHGFMGDVEVAVKMLNSSSTQGHKEFQAEVNLLMNVNHKYLTSLVGYCNEGTNVGIIYEYMANGNLQQHLPDLSWEQRLRIAVDAAQGLEYLHHGCKPQIIHRDINPRNILLNENFQAKLSDFGLSRAFGNESSTHVSINTIAGSPGYMDPECFFSRKLTKKSDIYSFGVVLLVIITGGPAINHEDRHIVEWVAPLVEDGDISTIVDEKLQSNFNIDSAWKAVELAMACVSRNPTARPTMDAVLITLKECLAMQMPILETEPDSPTFSFLEEEYDPQDLER